MRVVLISMPWCSLKHPSIQLGLLKGILNRHAIPCEVMSLNLAFFDYLAALGPQVALSVAEYEWIANRRAAEVGEWLFTDGGDLASFRQFWEINYDGSFDGPEQKEPWFEKLLRIRGKVPLFLSEQADEILAGAPRIVGFTSTFLQKLPSLALGRLLKERDPQLKIIFGGANCEGRMGAALARAFPWIDVVVRGEAEEVLPTLIDELLAGRAPSSQPGLCVRRGDFLDVVPVDESHAVAIEESPLPDYGEYFCRFDRSLLRREFEPSLVYEGSRGCWWGQRRKCTFCGLNGINAGFRSKSARTVYQQLCILASRYGVLRFRFTDNVISLRQMRELTAYLESDDLELSIFCEIRAHIGREDLRQMKRAGVVRVQPGIESLSTPILKLMDKGTTAIQNIRLLKWAEELGLGVGWSILYGFPSEEPREYEEMAALIPSLTHLQPPHGCFRWTMHRFSPYFSEAERFGLEILGPLDTYSHLFELPPDLIADLASSFMYRHKDGRDPDLYASGCKEMVSYWQRRFPEDEGKLIYLRGPDFVEVHDNRGGIQRPPLILEHLAGELYQACDAGVSLTGLLRAARSTGGLSLEPRDVLRLLNDWVERRIMFRDGNSYLSLAVARTDQECCPESESSAG